MHWRPNHSISSPISRFSTSPLKLVEVPHIHRIRVFGQTLPHRKRVGFGWWWKAPVGMRWLGSRTLSHSLHMDSGAGPSLFPLHRCKTVHLVRHAQGIHNVEGDKDFKAYMSPEYFDAHLTPLGWQQVDNLRKHVHTCGLAKRIDLVITSPLMRTLQTAVGVFGGEGYTDGTGVVPLMVAKTGNSDRAAISSLNCPPIIALELCRERERGHPCDNRRNISDYRVLFPAVDFSLVESDEDTFWRPEGGETKEEVAARGLKLINWLWTRKEKEIAIVSHGGFLFNTLSTFGNDCHPLVKEEIRKSFANCELRSMVTIDRSMIGSDSSTTNHPGGIPAGLDHPSDVVADKITEKGTDNSAL